MEKNAQQVEELIDLIFDDYSKDKVIDRIEMTNKPNKSAVRKLTYDLLQIVFPGYFRNKGYKIYNPKNLFATQIEDIFYHLLQYIYG
jgi:serine O-acetyltransferase